jgi:membrane-associated phospholipid phosphatase
MSDLSPRVRALTWLAVAGGVGLLGFYLVFVWVPLGQRWDDRALLGGQLASLEHRQLLTSALHGIRISTIGLMVVLLLVIGLVRRQLPTAIIVIVAFGGAVLSAEVLKLTLPRRDLAPELNAYVDNGNIDTYPSGHATIAMGFALALVIIASPRYRPAAAAFGMLWAAAISMAALAAGWHRPSDVLGGMSLALMWLAAAGAITVARYGHLHPSGKPARDAIPIAAAALLICAAALGAWIWWGDPSSVPVAGGYLAFVIAQAGVACVAVAIVTVWAAALRRVDFIR